eukprot:TRINITY_DN14077_c2_g1_i1.p1 TRINITY_DN14077_c2_g1~~TRINITY_DN14077_c2_g1_i1.p1  ORF type:complete len:198 (+),score=34.82 TRINITY_DN14077_c2_g1_i1:65-658(+)
MASYSDVGYWNERYEKDQEPFEWFQDYSALKAILDTLLKPTHHILQVGCGTSPLCKDLYNAGFRNIMNIDFSPQCISLMKQRYASLEEMKFETMDVRELPTAEKYDVILDKALLDSILCGGESKSNAEKMLDHVSRALSPGGFYICISHGQSTTRMPVLQNDEYAWTIETREIDKPKVGLAPATESTKYFVYICQKK